MRIVTALSVAAVGSALFAFGAGAAQAIEHPRVMPGDCSALVAKHGAKNVWQTTFYGDRRDMWDNITHYSASPCFASQAQCVNWLYWAQSDWPDRNNTTFCRRGIRY